MGQRVRSSVDGDRLSIDAWYDFGSRALWIWREKAAGFDSFVVPLASSNQFRDLYLNDIYLQLVNSVVGCVVNTRHKPARAVGKKQWLVVSG